MATPATTTTREYRLRLGYGIHSRATESVRIDMLANRLSVLDDDRCERMMIYTRVTGMDHSPKPDLQCRFAILQSPAVWTNPLDMRAVNQAESERTTIFDHRETKAPIRPDRYVHSAADAGKPMTWRRLQCLARTRTCIPIEARRSQLPSYSSPCDGEEQTVLNTKLRRANVLAKRASGL